MSPQLQSLICVQPDIELFSRYDHRFAENGLNGHTFQSGEVYRGYGVYVYGSGSSGIANFANSNNQYPCGWYIEGFSLSNGDFFPIESFRYLRASNLESILKSDVEGDI